MIDLILDDRYRLLRKLGEGGMAVVYLGNDLKLGRNVAIKILKEKFESHSEVRTRFQHEARIISAFDHPNILKVFDYSGSESKRMWIVTELVHGRNLGQIVETAPGGWLHPVIAACIVKEVSKALSVAHFAGIVHRDIKPDNVMMTQLGQVKLMDFGIAKIGQENTMTQTGMFMGSPSYMSPEQVRGRDVDARSDIYSLGVMFYELTTGKLPFSAQTTADVAMKILSGQYQHPRFLKEQIPLEVNDLIVSMMTSDSKNRPQAIETVSRSIDRYLENYGFESSSSELERCFRDPQAYGERLGKMLEATALVALPTQLVDVKDNKDRPAHLTSHKSQKHKGDETLHIQSIQESIRRHNEASIDQPMPIVPEIRSASSDAPVSKNSSLYAQSVPHGNERLQNIKRPVGAQVPPAPSRLDHRLPRRSFTPSSRRDYYRSIVGQLPERRLRMRDLSSSKQPSDAKIHSSNNIHPNHAHRNIAGSTSGIRGLPRQPQRKRSVANHIIYKEVHLREKSHLGLLIFALFTVFVTALIISQPKKAKDLFATNFAFFQKTSPSEHLKNQKTNKNPSQLPKPQSPKETTSIVNSRVTAPNQNSAPSNLLKEKSDQETPAIREVPIKNQNNPKITPDSSREKQTRKQQVPEAKLLRQQNILNESRSREVNRTDSDSLPAATSTQATEKSTRATVNKTLPSPNQNPSGKSEFRISSTPAAEIWLKGVKLGATNDAGNTSAWIALDSGRHEVELRRNGYRSKTVTLSLTATLPVDMPKVTLEKGSDSRPTEVQASPEKIQTTIAISVLGRAFDSNLMKTPIQVKILNILSREVVTQTATSAKTVFNLDKALYEITVRRQNEVKSRKIDLQNAQDPITYHVEFESQGASP